MDGLKSIGIVARPNLRPNMYDYVPETLIKLLSMFQKKTPDLTDLIRNTESSRLIRGIEEIVRGEVKDEPRENGDAKETHFERISEYFFPGLYSDPKNVKTNLYSGSLMEAYRDMRYYLTSSSDFKQRLIFGEMISIALLACAGLSADTSYQNYIMGKMNEALTSGFASAAFGLLATVGYYLYFVSPLARSAKKRAVSAIEYFPGTEIPRAAGLLASIWAHDSMEDGYWDKIERFISEGNFGDAGVFVGKVVNLVTRKNNYLERVTEYAAEVETYLESNWIGIYHLINKENKTDNDIRILDKLKIIIGYKNATVYEKGNEWRPEVDFNQIELSEYTDLLENILIDVKEGRDIDKYFKISGQRENYALFIRGIYTETDEYLREAAILIKKGDTCHNLETLPTQRIKEMWEKYLVKGALFEIGASPLYCTVLGQRGLHEIAGREFASLRALETIKHPTAR